MKMKMGTGIRYVIPFLVMTLLLPGALRAQATTPVADSADVSSVDGIVNALYESLSGYALQPRQWARFRSLFPEDAQLISTYGKEDGSSAYRVWNPESFIQSTDQVFVQNGFLEQEVHRETLSYGRVVHVFSTYAARYTRDPLGPFHYGINSIQLLHDGAAVVDPQRGVDPRVKRGPHPKEIFAQTIKFTRPQKVYTSCN